MNGVCINRETGPANQMDDSLSWCTPESWWWCAAASRTESEFCILWFFSSSCMLCVVCCVVCTSYCSQFESRGQKKCSPLHPHSNSLIREKRMCTSLSRHRTLTMFSFIIILLGNWNWKTDCKGMHSSLFPSYFVLWFKIPFDGRLEVSCWCNTSVAWMPSVGFCSKSFIILHCVRNWSRRIECLWGRKKWAFITFLQHQLTIISLFEFLRQLVTRSINTRSRVQHVSAIIQHHHHQFWWNAGFWRKLSCQLECFLLKTWHQICFESFLSWSRFHGLWTLFSQHGTNFCHCFHGLQSTCCRLTRKS